MDTYRPTPFAKRILIAIWLTVAVLIAARWIDWRDDTLDRQTRDRIEQEQQTVRCFENGLCVLPDHSTVCMANKPCQD